MAVLIHADQAIYLQGFLVLLAGAIWLALKETFLKTYSSQTFLTSVTNIRVALLEKFEKGKDAVKSDDSIKNHISDISSLSNFYFDTQYDYTRAIIWSGIAFLVLSGAVIFLFTFEDPIVLLIGALLAEFILLPSMLFVVYVYRLMTLLRLVELSSKTNDWSEIIRHYKKVRPMD